MASSEQVSPVQVRHACQAMGARFEFVLCGEDEGVLHAAAQVAVDEVLLWHERLTPFEPGSAIARLNASAGSAGVAIDGETMAFLVRVQELARATGGLFDPTVGPLMRAWGFRGDPPDPAQAARLPVGIEHLELDAGRGRARLAAEGMALDAGAVGKGWALDRAAEVLREAGVSRALLHGGTSSVLALPGAGAPWRIGLGERGEWPDVLLGAGESGALGVSEPGGRKVEFGGEMLGHVLDPRTKRPAEGARFAAVLAPTAVEADAWSTAALVAGGRPAGTPETITTYVVPLSGPPEGPRGVSSKVFVRRDDAASVAEGMR